MSEEPLETPPAEEGDDQAAAGSEPAPDVTETEVEDAEDQEDDEEE
jgi:hypothetical protein